jgi:molybdate transport system ATP-binding protein
MSLRVEISKQYKDFKLDINLINDGRSFGLLGASGCGKSLTLRCIAGLETPDHGRIILNDRVLFDSEKGINIPVQQRRIGMLFQSYALFPNMTVRENIQIGIRDRDRKKQISEELVEMLQLNGVLEKYPHQISGGEQQRVAIARMLGNEPEVMMFDEPFSALDTYLKHQLELQLLELFRSYKGDLMMVSHNREELYTFCDMIAVVKQGSIIEFGSKTNIFRRPTHLSTARLSGCKNISRARKKSEYVVEALDWKLLLRTEQRVGDNVSYVGIRAHDIIPTVSAQVENSLPVSLLRITESSHECHLFLQGKDWGNARFSCMIPRKEWTGVFQEKITDYVCLPKEQLLLMTEDNCQGSLK